MINVLALVIGLLVAGAIIWRFKAARLSQKSVVYPLLLATFPVYYWIFSIYAADFSALKIEILYGLPFLLVAWFAYKRSARTALYLLAIGFAGHGVYDVIHAHINTAPVSPDWWPEFCGAVDIIVGLYIFQLGWTQRR